MFILVAWAPIFYLTFVWVPVYLADILPQITSSVSSSPSAIDPWTLNFCMLLLHTVLMPLFGAAVDRWGQVLRDPLEACRGAMQLSALTGMGLAYPPFLLLPRPLLVMQVAGYLCLVLSSLNTSRGISA